MSDPKTEDQNEVHPVHQLEAAVERLMQYNYSDKSIHSLCATAVKKLRPNNPPSEATVALKGTSAGKGSAKFG